MSSATNQGNGNGSNLWKRVKSFVDSWETGRKRVKSFVDSWKGSLTKIESDSPRN